MVCHNLLTRAWFKKSPHLLVTNKTVDEMKRHMQHFVKNDLFAAEDPRPVTNSYRSNDVDIRNHMYKAAVKQIQG